jgi:translation initiation factor eIF-2B subunit alpha
MELVQDQVVSPGRLKSDLEVTDDVNVGVQTILVHSYSRVVIQALVYAHSQKKRFSVYVTESRPYGLGIKTHALLTAAGIESIVILDSAVAWIMGKVDLCLVGSEAVCESGGLVNFIGSYQMAITAKACGKPL